MKRIVNCKNLAFIIAAFTLLSLGSCKKYLDEPLPAGTISNANAFNSDNSVSSVVTGNFENILNAGVFGGSYSQNLEYSTGLYTDELINLNTTNTTSIAFYTNAIATDPGWWQNSYNQVYGVNAALTGIETTTAQLYYKNQWLGESYFSRALLYFYLTNLYGAVPVSLTTDVTTNDQLPRTAQTQVYQQIVSDLKQAQGLLNGGYTDAYGASTSSRVRPNRYAALALLAKVYLYTQKWDSAEMEADSVITNSIYALAPLTSAFTSNSTETIWALSTPTNTAEFEYGFYVNGMPNPMVSPNTPTTYQVYACLDTNLVNTFEPGDNRLADWVRTVPVTGSSPALTYYFPYKYNSSALGGQNQMVLRLGETYLIRAEARAEQGELSGAQSDLNAVRTRAGLGATTATDEPGLLSAIAHERRVELFTEGGNRFFDLKRTGKIDSVMGAFAPVKGGTWSDYMQLFPLPINDLQQDANLTQNPGYTN